MGMRSTILPPLSTYLSQLASTFPRIVLASRPPSSIKTLRRRLATMEGMRTYCLHPSISGITLTRRIVFAASSEISPNHFTNLMCHLQYFLSPQRCKHLFSNTACIRHWHVSRMKNNIGEASSHKEAYPNFHVRFLYKNLSELCHKLGRTPDSLRSSSRLCGFSSNQRNTPPTS